MSRRLLSVSFFNLVFAPAIACTVFLAACGGGGGGGSGNQSGESMPPLPLGQNYFVFYASTDDQMALYRSDYDGSSKRRMSHLLGSPLLVSAAEPRISPDGRYIAYSAATGRGEDTWDYRELYVTPSTSRNPVKLSAPNFGNGKVQSYVWSPDSTMLAYKGFDPAEPARQRAYVVNAGDGERIDVSLDMTDGNVSSVQKKGGRLPLAFSPDSSKIAYLKYDDVASKFVLVVVNVDGSDYRELDLDAVDSGVLAFAWVPASDDLIYQARKSGENSERIFRVDSYGTLSTPLASSLEDGVYMGDWAVSPDGSKVALKASTIDPGSIELVIVDADGTNAVVVDHAELGNTRIEDVTWSPDSTHIGYRITDKDRYPYHTLLYVVDDRGISPVRVSHQFYKYGLVEAFKWSPDSQWLLYDFSSESEPSSGVFAVTRRGDDLRDVLDFYDTSRALNVKSFDWGINSDSVLYVADRDEQYVHHMYTTGLFTGPHLDISSGLPGVWGVWGVDVSPDMSSYQ